MAFDWFRRQFNDPAQAVQDQEPEAQESEAQESEVQPSDARSVDAPPDPEPEISADYLTWAQVAYQNIKKRQQSTEETAVAPTVTLTADVPEVNVPEIDVPEASAPEASAPEASAEAASAPESDASPVSPSMETPSAEVAPVAADAIAPPHPDAIVEPLPTPPLPFWAQPDDADRRLERLRETAIVEPENPASAPVSPKIATAPLPTDPLEPLEVGLDEGFLWSAEILASQGRRPDQISMEEITWLNRLRQGLDKTRRGLINQLRAIVGQGPLNADAVLEIEAALLQADVGVAATDAIISALQEKLLTEVLPPDAALQYLKQIIRDLLDTPLGGKKNLTFAPQDDVLNIWLITGVNGAGKTTTIGKLAHIAQKSGYRCLIAAADTFRAAAVEQVKVWGERSGVEVIANPGQNTDPAAVVFDAIAAAQARGANLLLIDTAGRLQNKKNLMDELSKVRRIIDKKASTAVIESLLVLDSTLGQNGLRQAEVFSAAAQLSGVVLTKLDGTAKGGIALAVVQQLGLPIRFIGAGEGIEDLRPFSSYEFVEALLNG